MNSIPTLSVDLISQLDKAYPRVLPDPNRDRGLELYEAGQRRVVDLLLQLLSEENANV